MTLLAGAVIDAARDEHAAFDRVRHPDKGALRFLSRKVRELQGRVVAIDPSTLLTTDAIDLPLDDFDEGVPLADNRTVVGVAAIPTGQNNAPVDLTLIAYELRNDRKTPAASAFIRGGVLYLAGDANRWRMCSQITVSYIATPDDLTTLNDEVALPDAAEMTLTAAVAAFFARRTPGMDPNGFNQREGDTEAAYLRDVANRLVGQTSFVRDVTGGY